MFHFCCIKLLHLFFLYMCVTILLYPSKEEMNMTHFLDVNKSQSLCDVKMFL